MYQATALISFEDLKEGVSRMSGDVFLVDDERGGYLAGLGLVRLKDAPEEKPKKAMKKTTKKSKE